MNFKEFTNGEVEKNLPIHITKEFCIHVLSKRCKSVRFGCIVIAVVTLIAIFADISWFDSYAYPIPFFTLCTAPFLIIFVTWNETTFLKIKRNDFYIKKDICDYKKVHEDSDSPTSYILFFKAGGKYLADNRIYYLTNVGAYCYTLHIGKSKKIRYSIPLEHSYITVNDFIEKGGCYFPIKES